ncbi:MAG: ribonuclease Z [Bacteroidales bacterium]
MVFKVTILGSNSAIPTIKRNPTAQIVNHNEHLYLVDCAEGTQVQLRRNRIKMQRINHIFISHLHGDHFFGLIGLISSMHLLGRKKDLHIYGPPQLEDILNLQLEVSLTVLNYPMIFHPINPDAHDLIYEDANLTIKTIPLKHSIPTCGFIFKEKKGKRKIKKDAVQTYNIPKDQMLNLKNGEDFIDEEGNRIENKQITDDPFPIRSYAYCSDTNYYEKIIPLIMGVNLLYHEATFTKDFEEVARAKFHSTSADAATIAKKAGVEKLLIGHFSTRYETVDQLLDEARKIFPNTDAVTDGNVYEIE